MTGHFRLRAAGPGDAIADFLPPLPNTWTDAWMHLVAASCAGGDPRFALSHLYLEFENVADPEDAVAVPAVDPTDADATYYRGLAAPRDYLRLPIARPVEVDVAPGFGHLPVARGNRAFLRAYADATAGVNGVPFGAAHASKVCGLAVAAAVGGAGDPTRDLLFARAYYAPAAHRIAPGGTTLLVEYRPIFGPSAQE